MSKTFSEPDLKNQFLKLIKAADLKVLSVVKIELDLKTQNLILFAAVYILITTY